MKLFYSWQSDIKKQRNLIEKSLLKAIKRISADIEVEIALDRDTKGTSGSTDIADEILRKVSKASIFVADITFINSSFVSKIIKSEKYPNPNVLIELGYAIRKIGYERIILLINTKYGKVEELPFDLRHRRVLTFNNVDKEFENNIYGAIKAIVDLGNKGTIPNRDIDEEHDIEVFRRIIKNIPENDLQYMMRWIANNGYYKYNEVEFITFKNDDINLPKNKFLNEEIEVAALEFGRASEELTIFMMTNFTSDDNNLELAKMHRYERMDDEQKQAELVEKLFSELAEVIKKYLNSFENFRLTVKKILRV